MSKIEELISKHCPNGVEYSTVEQLCKVSRGRVMSKDYLAQNIGDYPVYSSQTVNDGMLGRINTYDYDGEYLTWTTDGANAGSVFFRSGKFSITNVCGLLDKKSDDINIKFMYYYLAYVAKEYVNEGMGNPKLMSNVMQKIKIPLPPLSVQQEIVRILDGFSELEKELEKELVARRKQYEYYRNQLVSFGEGGNHASKTMSLYEITIWDKKFNGVDKCMQDKVIKYPYLLADELVAMKQLDGDVFLLATGENVGWTTEDIAGDYLCEGEVVSIPWGKSRPVVECMKYYKGKFVTADNRIATSKDTSVLNNKYLFYWMQTHGNEIDKFYRGAGIQHPNMKSVLTMKIHIPSLAEQERIVAILDKFDALVNDISVGLPAELKARRKQYEYWRNKLLDFKEAV